MKLKLRQARLYERDVQLRLPFRFGVVTLREAPQIFVRALIELENGETAWGNSAELLAPKWFDKNTDLSNEDNFEQLRDALRLSVDLYRSISSPKTPFDFFAENYEAQIAEGARRGLNALIASFGPALLDRAILDGACRMSGLSFSEAIRTNLPGVRPGPLLADLDNFDLGLFLASLTPLPQLHARHTVGLLDAIRESDVKPLERLDDGLPESLEAAIEHYGHRYFKIKVSGDSGKDQARLESIAALLDTSRGSYHVTLDGNEQFSEVEQIETLLDRIIENPRLKRLSDSILFLEQPLSRVTALQTDIRRLTAPFPVIIDESDGRLSSFSTARDLGYSGVSTKACKGFYKAIINAARCALWNRDLGRSRFFMAAEDLTTQAGIALQQDLAIVSTLGIHHVERNGHHYVDGMAGLPVKEQRAFLEAHPDLYKRSHNAVRVNIEKGILSIGSLSCSGFGVAAEPDWSGMRSVEL